MRDSFGCHGFGRCVHKYILAKAVSGDPGYGKTPVVSDDATQKSGGCDSAIRTSSGGRSLAFSYLPFKQLTFRAIHWPLIQQTQVQIFLECVLIVLHPILVNK